MGVEIMCLNMAIRKFDKDLFVKDKQALENTRRTCGHAWTIEKIKPWA
jgi:hypothetical protein